MGIAYIVSDGHVMVNGSTNGDSLYLSDGHVMVNGSTNGDSLYCIRWACNGEWIH